MMVTNKQIRWEWKLPPLWWAALLAALLLAALWALSGMEAADPMASWDTVNDKAANTLQGGQEDQSAGEHPGSDQTGKGGSGGAAAGETSDGAEHDADDDAQTGGGAGEDADTGADGVSSDPASPFPIPLNSATLEQLDLLPGIGPSKAAAILEYRQRVGKFTSVEDLLNVKGIGKKTLENIRHLVRVDD
jgi:competence protein ComEA